MLASIPSPPFDQIDFGPLHLRIYGLMIASGVAAAVWLSRRRTEQRGEDPEIISRLATWCVPAGLVGARLYHVITDWHRLYANGRWWPNAFELWNGGLGIPGAIAAGFAMGVWYARRHHISMALLMDVVAPALPLAQAIGRLGNYFNQELFGRPTHLPWGLKVDSAHRPVGYEQFTTFHPTFLYEGLWNLAAVGVLLWMDRHLRLRPGKLFPAYVVLYFSGRAWVEELRIDTAARVVGLRWNFVLSLAMIVVGVTWFFWSGATQPRSDEALKHADDSGQVV